IELMDAEREQALLSYGELILLRGPWVQYRLTLVSDQPPATPALHSLTLILIDSQDGPIAQGARASAADPPWGPTIISREEWGANESLMTVSWPPEYRPVEMFVIHHTVTPNDDVDPYATVRAIYYYHGVTRGWGDIGYNYLIDAQGRIYEGRAGGERVGDQQLEAVVGGHAKIYNWGSIGIAILGDYREANVPPPALASLVELIAWKANQHLVNPTGYGYVFDEYLPRIAGHRDVGETTCPGQNLYARLGSVRTDAWARLLDLAPVVRIGKPLSTEPATALVDVFVSASPQADETVLLLDAQQKHSESSDRLVWRWNTTGSVDGLHTLRAEVRSPAGRTGTDEITVTVDNTPPGGSLDGPDFTNAPTITLSTWSDSAHNMAFSNSWLWEGEDLRHEAQTGVLVSDPDAWNGQAWMGRAGTDTPGWWYGPYYKDLPTAQRYRIYFRLNVGDNTTSAEVALLDIVDDQGGHTYVSRALTGLDFVGQRVYQEPYLDFYYAAPDEHGLEFRTYFPGTSTLYLDRVHLFSRPRSYATHAEWILPPGDGPKVVEARYIDGAGNLSPIYKTTVLLDTALPQWQGWDGTYAWVRDDLSGLHASSAQYVASTDHGQSWGDWQTAAITATEGSTDTVPLGAPTSGVTNLRFRIEDRAGNLSESPTYDLGTPTPTPTVTPVPGSVRGQVTLQGRTRHDGAEVSITDIVSTTTYEDGAYSLAMVPPGVYSVTVDIAGYLETHRQGITVSSGAEIDLPDVTLHGGDANNDCIVDLLDLVIVSYSFDQSPPADSRADINQDGTVNIFDLVLVTSNYDLACPGPWPEEGGSAATAGPNASAVLVLRVGAVQVAQGDTLRLDILARDVVDLAGVDLLLQFDRQLLRAHDMDDGAEGVQMQPLFAAPYDGHVARNSVDNDLGAIRYAAAVLRPAPPANGQVFIASAEFEALDDGIVHFECHDVTLLDTQVKPLRVTWMQESAVFLPCLLKSE
ncbi:MAG TPA: N-acetylmuramoyl-L-alanine amidase, partial [Anaerolineae bacterium]|nr:N-acetylmuramoyl-L-alanine amidase [Anaerolineae bacterium]